MPYKIALRLLQPQYSRYGNEANFSLMCGAAIMNDRGQYVFDIGYPSAEIRFSFLNKQLVHYISISHGVTPFFFPRTLEIISSSLDILEGLKNQEENLYQIYSTQQLFNWHDMDGFAGFKIHHATQVRDGGCFFVRD